MSDTRSIDFLISNAVLKTGVDPAAARAAIVGALGLLDKHADPAVLAHFYAMAPGAEAAARSPEAAPKKAGFFGGLMKSAGGVSGAVIADGMGLLEQLKKQGLERAEVRRLVNSVRWQVRDVSGRDLIGDALRTVPGVGAMLGDG